MDKSAYYAGFYIPRSFFFLPFFFFLTCRLVSFDRSPDAPFLDNLEAIIQHRQPINRVETRQGHQLPLTTRHPALGLTTFADPFPPPLPEPAELSGSLAKDVNCGRTVLDGPTYDHLRRQRQQNSKHKQPLVSSQCRIPRQFHRQAAAAGQTDSCPRPRQ